MKGKNFNRYSVSQSEDFEKDSNNTVLKNFLSIISKEEMDKLEAKELKRAELELPKFFNENHSFTIEDICNIHELWLGDIYPFAGRYRTVNLFKDGFSFAAAERIKSLMNEFEKNILTQYTPCKYVYINELAYALGIVHAELILIHPFREGNGRTARLLADLMALQANRPPLNYSYIEQKNKNGFNQYIFAIQKSLENEYRPIQEIFTILIEQSL